MTRTGRQSQEYDAHIPPINVAIRVSSCLKRIETDRPARSESWRLGILCIVYICSSSLVSRAGSLDNHNINLQDSNGTEKRLNLPIYAPVCTKSYGYYPVRFDGKRFESLYCDLSHVPGVL